MVEEMKDQRMLMGNEAIARGLVENGCTMAASYPGTPASEILGSVALFSREADVQMHVEWSINEKVSFETALAHTYTGKRAAVSMKQVGLNVAADPFMRSAYLGNIGGFIVVVADDPGTHSSQTEQDSRMFAHFAKIPVLDPSSPRQAKEMVGPAFELSEKYQIPVMIRPTMRVCHARQNVPLLEPRQLKRKAFFEKNPGRWASTPATLPLYKRLLNEKTRDIAEEEAFAPVKVMTGLQGGGTAVVASGVVFAHVCELLEDLGLAGTVDLFQVVMPFPLNKAFIALMESFERVLVLEETYTVIELQLPGTHIAGRKSGHVPSEGELTPDVIQGILTKFLKVKVGSGLPQAPDPGKRPSLCAGCSHRAAFYAIRETFPKGIFPSDIGCYTLGLNLGAVDTCHCMGACVSQGAGFYHAYAQDGDYPTVVVTLGDSTFFHAGIPPLINGVLQKARFILVILDNATTAMTGHQPVPHMGLLADGTMGTPVSIDEIVKASGVGFLEVTDPYRLEEFMMTLKKADVYMRSEKGGVAVVIARHPCLMDKSASHETMPKMTVSEDCTGCMSCIEEVECPALIWVENDLRVVIDENLCNGCAICVRACPAGVIDVKEGGTI